MKTFQLNVFPQIIIFIILLVANNSLIAIPKSILTEKEMKLAMLDFSRQGFTIPNKQKSAALSVTQTFPSNCLKWNAWQIKQKSKKFDKLINKYSRQYQVDSNLIKSVITAESCFKVKALSHAGAQGLMQLIPATAKRFGVKDSYKPERNIRGGVKYLKFLLDRFNGKLEKVIAAYNAGEGRVDQYNGIPPYKETQQYVKNVLKVYSLLKPKPKKKTITRAKTVYQPPKLGQKPGRHGWQYNRRLAPHLYKQ